MIRVWHIRVIIETNSFTPDPDKDLLDCESFVCNQKYFKCPGYYCIPWRLVCNGLWDCPGGAEEKFMCNRPTCPGQFKCHNTSICISPESICDDIFDCILADDEHFCHPLLPNCPENCICVIFIFLLVTFPNYVAGYCI